MNDLQQELATLFSFELPESSGFIFDAENPVAVENEHLERELSEVEALVIAEEAKRLALAPPSFHKGSVMDRIRIAKQQRFPSIVLAALDESQLSEPKAQESVIFACRKGLVQWVNPAFTAMCGYTLGELRGRKPGPFVQGPATDPASIEALREAIKTRKPIELEMANHHRAGRTYHVRIDLRPVETGFIAVEREL